MNRSFIPFLLIYCIFAPGTLSAQAPQDPAEINATPAREAAPATKVTPAIDYKLGMQWFFGYEATDHDENGQPDDTGPTSQQAGFWMERVFVGFRGKVNQPGAFQDWKWNLTTDINLAGNTGDGCGATCDRANDSVIGLRSAWLDVPLRVLPDLSLRFGVQDHPLSGGQAGYNIGAVWANRTAERSHIQEAGLNDPVDRGISLIHSTNYTGLHLFLANGESWRRTNGQDIRNTSLSDLSTGAGDSYGLELAGMATLIPTGKKREITWYINAPFRLENFTGISGAEVRRSSVDFTGATPQFQTFVGDTRAKRDVLYGLTTDVIWKSSFGELAIGGGGMTKIDRRANAYRLDQNALNGVNASGAALSVADFSSYVQLGSDSPGLLRFAFLRYRYQYVGFFGRYMIQTQTDTVRRQLQTVSGKSWAQQALELDAANGQFGDLGFNSLRAGVDTTQGRLRNITYGVTFFPSPRSKFVRISVGVTEKRGTDLSGRKFRSAPTDNITGSDFGVDTTLTQQLEADSAIKSQLGIAANDSLELAQLIGRKQVDRAVWIRGEFNY